MRNPRRAPTDGMALGSMPRPWLWLAFFAVAAAAALGGWPKIQFDHDTRALLRTDAAGDVAEDRIVRTFGSEDVLLVAWRVGDALRPDAFGQVQRVTAALGRLAGLEEVYSLASPRVKLPLDTLRPLAQKDLAFLSDDPERRSRIARLLRESPVYAGLIYNPDLSVVAVVSTLRPGTREERMATVEAIRSTLAPFEREAGQEFYLAGVSALVSDASAYAVRDLRTTGLWALAIALCVLWLVCGRIGETLVAAGATVLPPLYALGLAGWLQLPLSGLGAALFPVLGVVGITSSIHFLSRVADRRRRGERGSAAAWSAARELRAPVGCSLLTTAAAFFGLTATGVPAFRSSGWVVGLGILAALPVVLFGLPAALTVLGVRPGARGRSRLHAVLGMLAAFSIRRRFAVAIAGLLLVGGGAWWASGAPVRVDVFQAFQETSRVARTYRFLEDNLTASVYVDLSYEAHPWVETARVLEDLQEFEDAALGLPGVSQCLSLRTLVDYGHAVMEELGVPGWNLLEPSTRLAAVLQVLRRPETGFAEVTGRFEEREESWSLRRAAARLGGASAITFPVRPWLEPPRLYRIKVRNREDAPPATLDGLEGLARQTRYGAGILTGLYVRSVTTAQRLLGDMARGVILTALLCSIIVAFALGSVRFGLCALLPNLLPAVVMFGAARLAWGSLDVAAVAVGFVAVGLAVDDTFHWLFRYRVQLRAGLSPLRATFRAHRTAGRAILFSSVVLAGGLGCLAWSTFRPTAHFGIWTAGAVLLALPADLILLPALVVARRADRGRR